MVCCKWEEDYLAYVCVCVFVSHSSSCARSLIYKVLCRQLSIKTKSVIVYTIQRKKGGKKQITSFNIWITLSTLVNVWNEYCTITITIEREKNDDAITCSSIKCVDKKTQIEKKQTKQNHC